MSIRDLLRLWRLGRRRLRSEEDYRNFQSWQGTLLLHYLRGFGVGIEGSVLLDLGSGVGGYSLEMLKQGATVVSLDLVRPSYIPHGRHGQLVADALCIPLRSEAVDVVFCASLIEHVSEPAMLLSAIWRVLRQGGYCYLSFPPFYSLRGGHEFSPFHYLGERCAMRLASLRRRSPAWVSSLHRVSPNPHSYADIYEKWGLFKMTVSKAKKLVATAGFETIDISTRYFATSTARWPVLGEILTWHAQFLLRKPRSCS